MALIDLVGGNNYIPVSRKLCVAIGPAEAILYCELIDQYRFWERCGKLDDEGMFFLTVEQVKSRIGLSKDQQFRYLKKLSNYGLIKTTRKGLPAKRYIKIYENPPFLQDLYLDNADKAPNIQMVENPPTSKRKTRQLVGGKSATNKPIYNKPNKQQQVSKYNLDSTEDKIIKIPNPVVEKEEEEIIEFFIENKTNPEEVIQVFKEYGLNIKKARKSLEYLVMLDISTVHTVAKYLSQKNKSIKNPIGLLESSPQYIIESILAGKLYPETKKKAKINLNLGSFCEVTGREYEIYTPTWQPY